MPDDTARLRELLAKATKGPWEIDSEYDNDAHYSGGGGCGTGFRNYFIGADVDGKWKTLFDTVNSDHKLIEEDYDEDGKEAWDAIGKANAELALAAVNALPALLDRIEALEAGLREIGSAFKKWDPDASFASTVLAQVSKDARALLEGERG